MARRSRMSVRSMPRQRCSRAWPLLANCRCSSATARRACLTGTGGHRQFLPRADGGHGARTRLPSRRGHALVSPGGRRPQPPHVGAPFRRRRADRGQACAARQRALHGRLGLRRRASAERATERPQHGCHSPSLRLLRPLDQSVAPLLTAPAWCCSSVFGRLRPGVTTGQAAAQLEAGSATFARQHGLDGRASR